MNPTAGVKSVAEIASGGSNERSVDGGQLADVSVRNWRVILESPAAAYDVQEAIQVWIGDTHPVNVNLPCVSISEKVEGESRVVRIVTATYRTTPGTDPENDPNTQPPDIRPATYSITSSLMEVPATSWKKFGGVWVPDPRRGPFGQRLDPDAIGAAEVPVNPNKDRYDGVSMLVPIISINIEQFDNFPTRRLDDAGKVNEDEFTFLGLTIAKCTCMLRNIAVRPVVESFGDATYRGFMRTFEFAIKTNGGWLIEQLVEGFNITNDGLGRADVDQGALNLEILNEKIKGWPNAPELAAGTQGKKMRACVLISGRDGAVVQRPSAQPVALNLDGTPRKIDQVPPVLTQRYLTQGTAAFGNNFVNMGIRIHDIV
jgi:hypothetical protein